MCLRFDNFPIPFSITLTQEIRDWKYWLRVLKPHVGALIILSLSVTEFLFVMLESTLI